MTTVTPPCTRANFFAVLVCCLLAALTAPASTSSGAGSAHKEVSWRISSLSVSGNQGDWANHLLRLPSVGKGTVAASVPPGRNGSDQSGLLRTYGTTLFVLMLALIFFLLIFRGQEIRRQHPKLFH